MARKSHNLSVNCQPTFVDLPPATGITPACLISERPSPGASGETAPDLSAAGLRQTESLFALANGHIGLRGNLDENDPRGMPGTYLNSFFEVQDMHHAEAGYAFPEQSETVVGRAERQTHRGCSSTTSRSICVPGRCAATNGCSTCGPACCAGRPSGCRRPGGGTDPQHPVGLLPVTRRGRVRYEVEPLDPPVGLRVASDLLANEEQPEQRTTLGRATVHHPLRAGDVRRPTACWCTAPGAAAIASRAVVTRSTPTVTPAVTGPGPDPLTSPPPGARAADKFARLRVGRSTRLPPTSAARSPTATRPARSASTRWPTDQRAALDDVLAGRRRASSTAIRRCSRPSGSGCSTCSRPVAQAGPHPSRPRG